MKLLTHSELAALCLPVIRGYIPCSVCLFRKLWLANMVKIAS